jgi:DNA-binding MarR family transcriptional regulator
MSDTDVGSWAALLRVHAALVPLIDRELQAACGLPLTWYDVLLELNSAPGRRLNMGELGEVAVDQLVTAGLVSREPNPDDRRSAYATITEDGRARLRAAAPTYLASIRRHFTSRMTAAESGTVASALAKVLSDLSAGSGEPSDAPAARRSARSRGRRI